MSVDVLCVADLGPEMLGGLLSAYRLSLVVEDPGAEIRGSYWGDREAGCIGTTIYVRDDTPIHSVLHETGHIICMTNERRVELHRDAGGDDLEEEAVCYLQVLLADHIEGVGRDRIMADMDSWGYSFRCGSTRAWFENDAEDAKKFLLYHKLMTMAGELTMCLRGAAVGGV